MTFGIFLNTSNQSHGHYFNGKIYDVVTDGRYGFRQTTLVYRPNRVMSGVYWDFGRE